MGESCFVFPSLFKVRHPCVPICDLCLNIVVQSSLLSSCILVRYANIRMYRNIYYEPILKLLKLSYRVLMGLVHTFKVQIDEHFQGAISH